METKRTTLEQEDSFGVSKQKRKRKVKKVKKKKLAKLVSVNLRDYRRIFMLENKLPGVCRGEKSGHV